MDIVAYGMGPLSLHQAKDMQALQTLLELSSLYVSYVPLLKSHTDQQQGLPSPIAINSQFYTYFVLWI